MSDKVVVGFDIETDLITTGNKTPQLVCLSLAGGRDSTALATSLSQLPDALVDWSGDEWGALLGQSCALKGLALASNHADVLVAHNMPYDVAGLADHSNPIRDTTSKNDVVAWAIDAVEQGSLTDTLVSELLIAIALDCLEYDKRFTPVRKALFSLAALVDLYFGEDISGDKVSHESLLKNNVPRSQWPWRYKYIDLLDVPVKSWPSKAAAYAIEDSVWARRIWYAQRRKKIVVDGYPVVRDGVVTNEKEQVAAALALHFMGAEGVAVDPEVVSLFEQDIDALLKEYDEACRALTIVRINRCKTCGDNQGGTGYVGVFPNLRQCPTCNAMDHQRCLEQGVYKKRTAQAGIGKLYVKRIKEIVRWGYKGDPPMTERPRKQSAAAYAKWVPSIKTDEETLSAIDHPQVQRYVTGKKATKWKGTYLPPLKLALEDTGRLCAAFNVLVRSGRTSCRAPNLQNPPKKGRFRECFRPHDDSLVMASIDYSTLELAVLAQVNLIFFGESRMAELINAGMDLHAWFGAKLLGIDYERMMAQLAQGEPTAKTVRQLAKVPNFGLPGGLGPKGLVKYALNYGVFLEIDETTTNAEGVVLPSARDLCREWKAAFPEMKAYFDNLSHASEMSSDGRFNILQLGSRRVRGGATYTSAANSYFQGLAADGAKAAVWELFRACYADESSPLYGCRMWNFIHDEVLFTGPRDTSHLWAEEASRIMVQAMRRYIPNVAISAPPALMERWYKSADPVYDENGVLLVWVPLTDLPQEAQDFANAQDLNKAGKALFASGYMDAHRAGASHDEALEEGLYLAETGRIG